MIKEYRTGREFRFVPPDSGAVWSGRVTIDLSTVSVAAPSRDGTVVILRGGAEFVIDESYDKFVEDWTASKTA
jgi:hypothetical protein